MSSRALSYWLAIGGNTAMVCGRKTLAPGPSHTSCKPPQPPSSKTRVIADIMYAYDRDNMGLVYH